MKKKSLVTLASLQNLAAVLFLLLAFPMVTTANEVEDSMQETDALENGKLDSRCCRKVDGGFRQYD
jgi:hypothetical protein